MRKILKLIIVVIMSLFIFPQRVSAAEISDSEQSKYFYEKMMMATELEIIENGINITENFLSDMSPYLSSENYMHIDQYVADNLISISFVTNSNNTRGFQNISRSKMYKGAATDTNGGGFKLFYQIEVRYSASYNENTYKFGTVYPATIDVQYLKINTSWNSHVYLANQYTSVNLSSDKTKAMFEWGFNFEGQVLANHYSFGSIVGADTIKV